MAKLPARYNVIAVPVVLSGMMSLLVSGVATFRALGPVAGFFLHWLSAWAISWPVAASAAILTLPLARWLVSLVVEAPPHDRASQPTTHRIP